MHRISFSIVLWLLTVTTAFGSVTDSALVPKFNQRQRQVFVYSGIGVVYGSIGTGLYYAWYKNYPTSRFHFFNDNNEWLFMDKAGHAFSCYAEAVSGINVIEYIGLKGNKPLWIGGLIGFGMQSMIEVMDGFSKEWGFSWGDMGANVVGTSLAMTQKYFWNEQRIKLCYSFHYSDLSRYRPEMLGSGFLQRTLKDYNGLTCWMSVNLHDFHSESKIPPWLNLALGYGAYGMLTANPDANNRFFSNGVYYDYSHIQRYRKFYFSFDVNLQKIKYIQKHPVLLSWAKFISPLKFPLPTMQFDKNGVKLHPIYF